MRNSNGFLGGGRALQTTMQLVLFSNRHTTLYSILIDWLIDLFISHTTEQTHLDHHPPWSLACLLSYFVSPSTNLMMIHQIRLMVGRRTTSWNSLRLHNPTQPTRPFLPIPRPKKNHRHHHHPLHVWKMSRIIISLLVPRFSMKPCLVSNMIKDAIMDSRLAMCIGLVHRPYPRVTFDATYSHPPALLL